jgi:hypothetical protein
MGRYLKGNTLLNLGRKRSCIPHPDVLFMMGKPPMKKALKHKKDENNLDWNKQGKSLSLSSFFHDTNKPFFQFLYRLPLCY